MNEHYILEIDYEYLEVGTDTYKYTYNTYEDAMNYVNTERGKSKYDGYRIYKVTTELMSSE